MSLDISSKMDPNAAACTRLTLAKFPQVQQIWTYATFPDHNNGRCTDYMVSIEGMPRAEQLKLGDQIAAWHRDNAKALGVNGVVWNRRVMGFPHTGLPAYRGPYGTWRPYTGPKPHTDHVHVEYDGTAPALTEYLTPMVVGPDPVYAIRPGDNNTAEIRLRPPGYPVSTIVEIGRGYALTESGFLYPLNMLTLKEN